MINEDFGYSHKQKKVWNWLSKNFRRATKFLPGFGENGSGNCEYGLTQIDGYGNEIQTVSIDKVKERLQVMCKGWFPDRNDRDEFVDVMVDTFCNKGYGLSKYGTVMKLKEGKDLDSIIRRVIREEVDSTISDAEYCVSHRKFDKSCGQKNARTNCKYRRIGKYLIIKGDNQPHRIEGMEQYGKKTL